MKSITSFFYTHRILIIVLILCISIFTITASYSFAQGSIDGGDSAADIAGAKAATATDDGWGLGETLANIVLSVCMAIGGIFLTLGGALLNGAITETILKAGWWLGDGSSVGTGIREMWTVVRDIFNIVFIFGFIWIGLKTILNADDSGAKKTLGYLIVGALLINFSLYFAQVVIDFSNIAAVQVHNQILKTEGIQSGGTTTGDGEYVAPQHGGVIGAFFDTINITSWWGGDGNIAGGTQIFIYALMMLVFLIIAGIVCGMGAILLIRRFISLIIYLILSPIMFAGWIFPAFEGYQKKWRKGFLEQAFFAPAFLFMLYLSLFVLGRMKAGLGIESDTQYGTAFNGSSFTIFLFFCMGIGFLYASIKVGEMMSIAGASGMASSLKAGGKYFSGAAQSLVYRNTAGRGLNWGVKQLDKLDQAADKQTAAKKFGAARFLRAVGVDESVRRSVEGASNKGINGARGREAVEKDQKTAKARTARSNQIDDIRAKIKAGIADPNDTDKVSAMQRAIKDASSAQILEMMKDKDDKEQIMHMAVAGELSDSQVKAIMDEKDGGIDDATKATLGATRGAAIATRLAANKGKVDATDALGNVILDANGNVEKRDATIADAIDKADASELGSIGFEKVLPYAGKLTAKQIEDWKDLTPTEKTQLKAARKTALETAFGGIDPATGGTNAANFLKGIRSAEERSKLPDSILLHPLTAPHLDTNTLTKIVDNPGLGPTELADIKAKVMGAHPQPLPGAINAAARAEYTKYNNFFKTGAGQRY